MKRRSACLLLVLSESLGGGSLILFAVFAFAGPVLAFRLNLSSRGLLYWDALLSLVFFVQHSVMVRRWFKDWLAGRGLREFHGAIYSVASGIALALAMVLWQRSPTTIVEFVGSGAWLLRLVGVLAIVGFIWGIRSLRTFDTFGRLPIVAQLRGQTLPQSELIVQGAYQWMRHPLMFSMFVCIWSNPEVTADRLLFNVLWTAWLVIGAFFEERDLVAELGSQYRVYQRVVPMLLPWRGPVGKQLEATARRSHDVTAAKP